VTEEDWLALPNPEQPAEKNPDSYGWELAIIAQQKAVAQVAEIEKELLADISELPLNEPPVDPSLRAKKLNAAWRKLTKQQQVFLTLLRDNKFNESATVRVLDATPARVSRATVQRWKSGNEDFAFVLKIVKTVAASASIDKERLLLRAEEIAESALEPTPILYQGRPTGFYENYKETALRANEQLMKASGMLKGDEKSQRVVVRVVNLAGPEDDAPPKQVIEAGVEVIE
jgi:hypothetical protein